MSAPETDRPVSRFGVVEPADLPDDLRQRIEAIAEKSGFVPNIFRALGRRPAELRAFLDYHDALMTPGEDAPTLSAAERELIVVATSGANHCTYCVVAHGAILRVRSKDPELADHVSANPYSVVLDDRRRAIVDLALQIATDSASLRDEDLEAARDAGLTDDEIWDIGSITALFAMSNRLAHLTALRPNPEFFLMGRLPRCPGTAAVPSRRHRPTAARTDLAGPVRPAVGLCRPDQSTLDRNVWVRWWTGLVITSRGLPASTITPPSMNTSESPTSRAKPISWVTTTIVMPSAASWRITSSTSPTSSGSRALVGSSKSMSLGSMASARAMATRCCWPPDSWAG
jgi:uncharacterized peroxidase-related enzyme